MVTRWRLEADLLLVLRVGIILAYWFYGGERIPAAVMDSALRYDDVLTNVETVPIQLLNSSAVGATSYAW
jgi:hypothetical protein